MLDTLVLDGKMRATQIRANLLTKKINEAVTLHLSHDFLLADQAIAKMIREIKTGN